MADMRDPNDFREPYRTLPEARGGGTWGWIVGAVVVVLIIGFIFGWGRNTEVASNNTTPPAATSPASPSGPAMAPRQGGTAMAPRPSTTGQGGQ